MRKDLFFLIVLFICQGLLAQKKNNTESNKDSLAFRNTYQGEVLKSQNWRISIPIWIPGFRGSFAYGDVEIDPGFENPGQEPNPGDRRPQSKLSIQFYLLANIRYQYKGFFIEADGMKATLDNDLTFKNADNIEFGGAIEATIIRGVVGYRFFESINQEKLLKWSISGYGGIRYYDVNIYTDRRALLDIKRSWIDPVLGIQVPVIYKRWEFAGQADYGGFGIDNQRSLWGAVNVNYRFSKLFALGAGWAHLNVKSDTEFKSEPLYIGLNLSGPAIRTNFYF